MKGSAADKVARDQAVVADRARGLPWAMVAERHGISERQARDAWSGRSVDLEQVPAREAIADELRRRDALLEDLALVADQTKNDSVRLGAIRTRHEVLKDRFALLQATGLTTPIALAGTSCQMKTITELIIGMLKRYDVDRADMEEVADLLEQSAWYTHAS